MHIDRIKISLEYTYHGLSRWVGMEASLSEVDDEISGLNKLEQSAKSFIQNSIQEEAIAVKQYKSPLDQVEDDFEFNALKTKLAEFEFQEEAQSYLDTTGYRMAVEAKKLVTVKPFKNK